MKKTASIILIVFVLAGCAEKKAENKNNFVIASGQMPALAKDKNNNLHLVYGSGDSIMYSYSSDNGNTFSNPLLISVLPHVYTYATRGPQIGCTDNGIVITACTSQGNIYSFYKENGESWKQGDKVNDVDTVAKEGLMALSADENEAYAVWLDLRGNRRNKICGAKSVDGGKTWLKNSIIYISPDSSVCECCKPSGVVSKNKVAVMFRNWLNGNRDLYLVQSNDGGNTFGQAQKLGKGSWQLDGCPMDGGSIALNNGTPETVWRRKDKIFTAAPGMPETEIGEGRGCTIEIANGKNIYTWIENGEIVFINSQGQKKILGKGSQPVLKALNNEQAICVWENEKQIHASVIAL
jgi:hypothetical protein